MVNTYPNTFAFVQIHVSDDYSYPWGSTRANFYQEQYVPMPYFDGVIRESNIGFSYYQSDYLTRRAVPTDVTIQLGGFHLSGATYQVTATVCIEAGGSTKTMRIYMVQVLDYWPPPPVADYSRNGFKQAATTQDVTLSPGECQAVVRNFTFDADSMANQANIKIIAWAQEPQSSSPPSDRAEVFQAAVMGWPFIMDCNHNSIDDQCDISCGLPGCNVPGCGQSTDCNFNVIPDECEPDCNGNDIPDDCDIAWGASEDCQEDGVPDECQLTNNDCNANGIPDDCDISGGTSDDCDTNGVPDECQPDCNNNGIADPCDISSGLSDDCQADGIPDECELTGNDCNANNVPDDCDLHVPNDVGVTFLLDADPGWAREGMWAYGVPRGLGSYNKDPASPHTGTNVFGYNLSGDYTTNMPVRYLTTGAINCSGLVDVRLRFWRWLGVDGSANDHANIQASNNGTNWTTVWSNPTSPVADTVWTQVTYDIAAVADHQATVYVRWGMGPTNASVNYPGWNLDDIEITGHVYTSKDCNSNETPDECEGGYANIATFVNQLLAASPNPALICIFDLTGDGKINGADIGPFVDSIL